MTTPTLEPPGDGERSSDTLPAPPMPPRSDGPPGAPSPNGDRAPSNPTFLSLLPRAAVIGAVAVIGLVALVAIVSDDTPVWAKPRSGRADRADLFVTIAVLVGAGLVATVIVAFAVHRLVLARRPGAPRLRTTLVRALPIAAVVLALLSLFAIARAELEPEPTDADRSTTRGTARLGDFDGDRRPDIGIDHDGDGSVNYVAPVEGSGNSYDLRGGMGRIHLDDLLRDGSLVAVDVGNDGSIEHVVTFDADGDGVIDVDGDAGFDASVLLDRLDRYGAPDDLPDLDLSDLDDLERLDLDDLDVDVDDEPATEEPDPDDEPADDPEPDGDDDGGPDLSALGPVLLVLLGIVAAAIIGSVLWSWYSTRSPRTAPPDVAGDGDEPDEATREAMAGTVADTIGSMLADPDPRTAIIGAYARLLEGLAECEVGRLPHEAPVEHLRRALTQLRVHPDPLHRLIELFELARFSPHPLHETHRSEALGALRAAAADLASTREHRDAGTPPPPSGQPVGAPR